MADQLKSTGKEVFVANPLGVFHALRYIYPHVSAVDGLGKSLILQGEGDIFAPLFHCGFHRVLGLFHNHVGHINPGHRHVRQNCVLLRRPRAQAQIARRCNCCQCAHDQSGFFSASALCDTLTFHCFRPPARSRTGTIFTHTAD